MAGLEARVQRVGQGLVVIALSLMAMVAIGSTTAHAENPTIQTPTVTASPVVTASPTPSNPVSTPANRVVRSAVTARGMNPDTCNTTISVPTTDCPVTMKLVATNLSAATSTYRIGDIVQFDISLATIRAVDINAIQAYLDFPVAELLLVTGPTNLTPRPVSSTVLTDDGIVAVASGAFGLSATVLKNSYTQTGTAPNIVGQINFDAGTALPSSGPTTNISLVPGTDTVIGSVFLRIRNNPVDPSTASHTISLKDSAASGGRYGIVSLVNGATTGTNILGPVSGTTVAVAQTIANVTAIPATPVVGTVRRIGDVVPVALVINPTTTVRNANRARVTATFNAADFMLVSGPTGSPPTAVTAGASTSFADTTGSAFGSPTSASSYTVSGTTGTVTITVTGINRLAVDAGSGPHVVATIYLRPLRRGSLDINTTAATIGEFTVSGDNPDFNWTITTTSGTVASVPAVRGTIGLGLTVTFPPAVTSGLAPPLEVTTTGTVATGTVTDLRFLDVQVAALAGTADMQQADQFDLDITYDQTQISFATSPASGTDFALASGTAANGNSAVAVATPGTVQVRLVRTATPSLLTTPTAVIRLRFSVLAGTPATSAITLGIATTTDIRQQTGTPYVTNLYDSGRDAQTLDVLPAVTRQKPSTLTVEALLQGRAASDSDARFIQTMRVGLRRPGETTFATRRAQPVTPPSVASDGTNPTTASATMRYTGTSARKSGSTTPLSTVTIGDLEPGTYDVLVKGRSALTVIIRGISLTPGGTTTAPATTVISLPEGDASGDDAINSADFVALSRTFGTVTTSTADFNQSGYVDAWDFSLLARNFGLAGPMNLANLATSPPLPTSTTSVNNPTTHDVTLALPAGVTLDRARVIVSGTATIAATCPPSQPAGITCTADTATRVTLVATTDGGAGSGGTVTLGQFTLAPGTPGTGNVSVTLAEASGHDSATPPTAVTIRAPVTGAVITVDPAATFDLNVTTQAGILTAGIDLTVGGTATATGGRATIDYDPAHFTATCAVTQPAGVTCDTQSLSGRVSFILDSAIAAFTGGPASIGTATLTTKAGATGEGDLRASVATLTDSASDPSTRTTLVTAPSLPGAETHHYTVTDGAIDALNARVTGARVSTRTTGAGASIWLASPAQGIAIAPGSIVPVSVGVTTGSQAIDATQIVLELGRGFEFVDASGANTASMLTRATGSPLPVVLRQALTGAQSFLELGFARQVGSSVGSFSGQGLLGTVYLRVTGTATGNATSGDAVTVVSAGTGRFETGLVSDGASVAATLGQLPITIDATGTLMIPGTVTVSPPVDAVIEPILAPIAGAPSNAPSNGASDGPAPTVTAPRGASRPATTASPVSPATAPARIGREGFVEDAIRGVITLAIPGRGAVELRTGIATPEPDAWCPVARHTTYIRLEDTGIAGATFGVEPGGVLDWVTPERSGCVNWTAIATGGLTFTKETIMQFQLARAAPGALLWVLDGDRNGELYEVDSLGVARYITAETFSSNQDHFTRVWANVIPVSSGQIEGLASRGSIAR